MKRNETRVSIVIPTYDRANLLPRAIGSVQSQTFQDWELIIVDDGSRDDTRDVVADYMSRDARIRCIYQGNRRQAAARNNGIRNARGEMIAFLDSDDTWMPRKLEKQVAILDGEPECGMVYGNQLMAADEQDPGSLRYPGGWLPSGNVFPELLKRSFYCSTQTILVRRAVLDRVGLFDEQLTNALEDWELTLRIAYHYRVACIDEPLVRRLVNHDYPREYVVIRVRNHKAILEKTFARCDVPPKEQRRLWKWAWFSWGSSLLQKGYYVKSGLCFVNAMLRGHPYALPGAACSLCGPIGRRLFEYATLPTRA